MQGSPSQPTAAAERPPADAASPPAEILPPTDWLGGASAALVSRLKRLAAATASHPELAQLPRPGPRPEDGDGRARIVLTGARTSKLIRPGTEPQQ